MWRNYVTVGIRSLVKSRTYAFINLFGLTIGLAALAIATGTIIGHAVRVARANPIHALRYE